MKYSQPKLKGSDQTPELPEIYLDILGYKEDGFFVEFGVGQTIGYASNTGFLADIGWSGLYYEPHKDYYNEALVRHKDNNVKIFNYGVGPFHEEVTMLPGDTVRQVTHKEYCRLGWLSDEYIENYNKHTVMLKPVEEALWEGACPAKYDILSIDVEGYELPILKSYKFDLFRPKLIVIELRDTNFSFHPAVRRESAMCVNILRNNEYKILFKDQLNTVFIDSGEEE